MQVLVGADPELFVRDQNGIFISGHNLCPGTKEEPFKVDRGAIQVDGTALEFNIDPSSSADEFVLNIGTVRSILATYVPNLSIVAEPVAEFTPEVFAAIPDDAKMLGCNPDFNAWEGRMNDPPDGEHPFRTASGHVHIGWGEGFDPEDRQHFNDCCIVARQLDYYLGIYTLLWDPDPRRRQMYGKAGAFRPKPYGMEYRVPSNVWLKSESLQRFVYEACINAVSALYAGERVEDLHGDLARTIIDNNITDWPTTYPELYKAQVPLAA